MKRYIYLLCGLLFTLPARADVVVSDVYIPVMPPASDVFSAYMTITNSGDSERSLVAVESPLFGAVHLHQTVIANGTSSMNARHSLIIGAGETVTLEPGGMHIMLMMPNSVVQAGAVIPLMLSFEDGEQIQISAGFRALN